MAATRSLPTTLLCSKSVFLRIMPGHSPDSSCALNLVGAKAHQRHPATSGEESILHLHQRPDFSDRRSSCLHVNLPTGKGRVTNKL